MGGSNSTEEKQVAEQAQLNVERAHLHSLSPTSALLHHRKADEFSNNNSNNNNIKKQQQQNSKGNTASAAPNQTKQVGDENLKSFISCLRAPPRVPIALNLDPTITGLVNYGNTCYANSVLQMLFHTPTFRHHICERFAQQVADLSAKSNGEIPTSYSQIISILKKHHSSSSSSSIASPPPISEAEAAMSKKMLSEWKDTVWFELASLFSKITSQSEKVSQKAKEEILSAATAAAAAAAGKQQDNANGSSSQQQQAVNITSSGLTDGFSSDLTVPCPIGNNTNGYTYPYRFPVVEPSEMIKKVRNTYFQFNNREQHDAHEFALTLLNTLFEEEAKFISNYAITENVDENGSPVGSPTSPSPTTSSSSSVNPNSSPFAQMVANHQNQQNQNQQNNTTAEIKVNAGNLQNSLRSMTGKTVTLTSCIECDTMTSINEDLIDVSCVLEQKSSLRHNAEAFTNHEILTGENKFRCDCCGSSCVARRRTIVSSPAPKILLLQIKRFRYTHNGVTKLNDFVPFSDRLRVPVYDAQNNVIGSQLYRLCAFVVHMGSYPMAGHYFCIAHHRTTKQWMVLNDEKSSIITERERMKYLGTCPDLFNSDQGNNVTAYVLSYEKDDEADEKQEMERIEVERKEKLRRKLQQQQQQQGGGKNGNNNKNGTTNAPSTNTRGRYEADVIV